MTKTGKPLTTDQAHQLGYERGIQDEREAITEYLELRVRLIARTVGRSTFENTCTELERLADDIRRERHL